MPGSQGAFYSGGYRAVFVHFLKLKPDIFRDILIPSPSHKITRGFTGVIRWVFLSWSNLYIE